MGLGAGVGQVRGDHGIEVHPPHLKSGPAQNQRIVLDVLPDLGHFGAFEQRPQPLQHRLRVELLGNAQIAVAEGDVPGLARLDGEGDADQVGPGRIEAGGFGVEGDAAGILQHLQKADEIGVVQNAPVPFAGGPLVAGKFLGQLVELHLLEDGGQRLAIRFGKGEAFVVHLHRDVVQQSDQLF